uniref:Frizzled/Smoothened family membrane region containing protein n=1 Tax=Wuchereria bancrofti TaxID=6293 RepID=A0AAF5PT19_WUCBA
MLSLSIQLQIIGGTQRCETITIPLCKGIGYNMTRYPNSYGHEKQEEAGLEVHQFYPLVEVGCYKHLKFFLCAMYTPICQDNYEKMVMPCMEVCLEAKKRCSPLMQQYGFKWPITLSCEQLPRINEQQTTGNICAAPPDTPDPSILDPTDSGITSSIRNRHPNYPIIGINTIEGECKCRCSRPFFNVLGSPASVANVSGCLYPCHSPEQSLKDQKFLTAWITTWSGTCFILSAFTVLTFLIEMERFQYPERPIFLLAFCQLMVSIGFIIRIIYGHEYIACDTTTIKANDQQMNLCQLIFLLIYFFGMAGSVWWVILSLTWVLAAASKWSSEAIASYANYFHFIAWSLPATQTIAVLIFGAVDGDPLSGICYVGNTNVDYLKTFVFAPLTIYLIIGVCFLVVGFFNLWRIRSLMQKHHPGGDNTSKMTQLMSKIGIFSVLYIVPAIFVLMVLSYEQHYRPLWERSQLCNCAEQFDQQADTFTLLALIKSASMLVIGWTSGVWIISRKTIQSWKRVLCCLHRSKISKHKYQAADIIYARSDCITPHMYNKAVRHYQGYSTPILPEKAQKNREILFETME